jgi:hypothetical protein
MRTRLLFGLLMLALVAATVFAVWPVVGGAPWLETNPTTPATPYFGSADVLSLATVQVATRGGLPTGTTSVKCTEASYRPQNGIWLVTCTLNPSAMTRMYAFNDRTGEVALP